MYMPQSLQLLQQCISLHFSKSSFLLRCQPAASGTATVQVQITIHHSFYGKQWWPADRLGRGEWSSSSCTMCFSSSQQRTAVRYWRWQGGVTWRHCRGVVKFFIPRIIRKKSKWSEIQFCINAALQLPQIILTSFFCWECMFYTVTKADFYHALWQRQCTSLQIKNLL